MELKDFVKQSLVAIAAAISEANDDLDRLDAIANPRQAMPDRAPDCRIYGYIEPDGIKRVVHSVEFDIAVFAAEGKETKGGIGIVVASVALGSQGKSDASKSSESRIKFSVPIQFPTERTQR